MHTRTVRHYAALLNMTHKQLNKLCTSFTGKTAKDYISNYIALEAKRQLASTNSPVIAITIDVRFNSRSVFYRVFRQEVGVTPSQYRQAPTPKAAPQAV